MDPPFFRVSFDIRPFKEKFRFIRKVLLINYLSVGLVIFIGLIVLDDDTIKNIITQYKRYQSTYFDSLSFESVRAFFLYDSLITAFTEEFFYRGPVFLAVRIKTKLILLGKNATSILIVAASLLLNYIWASGHTYTLPIFLSGLPLYWLTLKTKALWPAIFCHALFNFSLYILVQLLINLKII